MVTIAPTRKVCNLLSAKVFNQTVFPSDLCWMIECVVKSRENDLEDYLLGTRFLTSYATDTCFIILNDFLSSNEIETDGEYIYEVKTRGNKLIFSIVGNKYVMRIKELEEEVQRLATELDRYERMEFD